MSKVMMLFAAVLLLFSTSALAQVAAPMLNPNLDDGSRNPATVPWSYSRFDLHYSTGSTETQVAVPPSTTTNDSGYGLHLRGVGDMFSGYVTHTSNTSGATTGSSTDLGLAAQFGDWFGLGIADDSNNTKVGVTFVLSDVWYVGYANKDDGLGNKTDEMGLAYRTDEAHLEWNNSSTVGGGTDTLVAEGLFGDWLMGVTYVGINTPGTFTTSLYTLSAGLYDAKGWSYVVDFLVFDSDDGAGSFTKSSNVTLGASVAF